MNLTAEDYARLLALRTGLRHFQRWSEQQAEAAGLTPAQHQLLLAIRGHADSRGPTIGEAADYLLLRHHSTVELVDRAVRAGLVERQRDAEDHRVVRLVLTAVGAERIELLSALHLEELARLAHELPAVWQGLAPTQRSHGFPEPKREGRGVIEIERIYRFDRTNTNIGSHSVLVDRLWPRGVSKVDAPFDTWLKEIAPSAALRTWFGHDPARFDEFAERYRLELGQGPAAEAWSWLRQVHGQGDVVLITATKDIEHSHAVVLRQILTE